MRFAGNDASRSFADLHVSGMAWAGALGVLCTLLLVDLLVLHRTPKVPTVRRAALETCAWVLVGCAFGLVVLATWGGAAGGEWFSGYLIEYSLSIDNVFVWAVILSQFAVPADYQHRVLFWGVFGALVLRAGFIFAGVALVHRFEVTLVCFGVFLLYTAVKLMMQRDDHVADPAANPFLRVVRRVVPSTPELDGQRMFTRIEGRRVATPLFAVLVLVEVTDLLFAVDSVPAVLAVSHEQFVVFTSNAFAILGLRSLYFLLADMRSRFGHLQQGLSIILAFVGMKMILSFFDVHIATWLSLMVIVLVLTSSVAFSVHRSPTGVISEADGPPPIDER